MLAPVTGVLVTSCCLIVCLHAGANAYLRVNHSVFLSENKAESSAYVISPGYCVAHQVNIMSTDLKQQINAAVKDAMRAQAKDRLGVLRLITSEFKRVEVDERVEIDDARALIILDKMLKQRRDSVAQFTAGGRQELADKETFEIQVIQEYLPQPLSEVELLALIKAAIAQAGASSAADLGKVIAIVKPQAQGRCDMGKVSQLIKAQLV